MSFIVIFLQNSLFMLFLHIKVPNGFISPPVTIKLFHLVYKTGLSIQGIIITNQIWFKIQCKKFNVDLSCLDRTIYARQFLGAKPPIQVRHRWAERKIDSNLMPSFER